MPFFNELLKAGTGYLQGATSGLQYDREEERRNLEEKRKAAHLAVELATARDKLATSSLNRQLDQGRYDRTHPANVRRNVLLTNEAVHEQNMGFVADTFNQQMGFDDRRQERFEQDFQSIANMPVSEAVREGGATVGMTETGAATFLPRMQSTAERERAEAQADLARHNATITGIQSERAQKLWEWQAPNYYNELERKLAVGRVRDMADTIMAMADATKADLQMRIDEETGEAQQMAAITQQAAFLYSLNVFADQLIEGNLDPRTTFETWVESLSTETAHAARQAEIAQEYGLRKDLRQTPTTNIQRMDYPPDKLTADLISAKAAFTKAEADYMDATVGMLGLGDEEGVSRDEVEMAVARYMDARKSGDATQMASALKALRAVSAGIYSEAELERRIQNAIDYLNENIAEGSGIPKAPEDEEWMEGP